MKLDKGLARKRLLSRLAASFVAVTFGSISVAAAMPTVGDYDGDGLSDLAMASVNRQTGRTSYSIRYANGQKKTVRFAVPGDALVSGNFNGEAKETGAVVYVSNASTPLEWYTAKSDGTVEKRLFGTPGDQPIAGDFDCDGVIDRATFHSGSKTGSWTFALSGGSTVSNITFGKPSDRAFAADADGDGCSELFVARVKDGGIYFFSRKLTDTNVTTVQWGLAGDIPLEPIDMNGDHVPDYIVVREMGKTNVAFVRFSDSSSTTQNVGPKGTIPMTGNFTGQNGFAYFSRRARRFYVINPDTSVRSIRFGSGGGALIRPDGSVVQQNTNERLGVAAGGSGDYGCTGKLDLSDPDPGNKHNGNNSRGTIKLILHAQYAGHVRDIDIGSNGKIIDTMHQITPGEWGGRERFYGSQPISWYPNNFVYIVQLDDNETLCATIPIPTQNYN